MSTTGEGITLKCILNARCPLPQLTIAEYLAQRIVRKIEQRIWGLTDLGSIFSTALESVMHMAYQNSLEMLKSCNQQVPSALTDLYTELISELEGIEQKLDDPKEFNTMALCWRQTIKTEAPGLNSMINDWLEEAVKMPLEPSKEKHVQRNQVNEQEELVELNISQSSSSSMINIEGEDSTTGIGIDDNSQVIQTNLAINSDRDGQVITETNFEERRMAPSATNKDNEEILIEESNDIEEEAKVPTLDASEGNQRHEDGEQAYAR